MGSDWFIDRVLPALLLLVIVGLFTLYVNVVGLTKGTLEYREATKEYRKEKTYERDKQVDLILKNREGIIRIEERMRGK